MMAKGKCHFLPVCGASIARQRRAEQKFLRGDPCRNYILVICHINNQRRYINCVHYQIRIKLLERRARDEISGCPDEA